MRMSVAVIMIILGNVSMSVFVVVWMPVIVGVVIDMAVRVGVSILDIHSCSSSTAEMIQCILELSPCSTWNPKARETTGT